jgi:hypothetical protein
MYPTVAFLIPATNNTKQYANFRGRSNISDTSCKAMDVCIVGDLQNYLTVTNIII